MTFMTLNGPTDDCIKDALFDQLHQFVRSASPHDIAKILADANETVLQRVM